MFRVVSEDGHPVNGQLTFTLKLPGGAAPSAPHPAAPGQPARHLSRRRAPLPAAQPLGRPGRAPPEAASPGGGSSWLADNLLPLSGALLLVVIGAGALLRDRLRH